MKVLLIHARTFKFSAKSKALKEAEPSPLLKEVETHNALIAFTTVEIGDYSCLNQITTSLTEDLKKHIKRIKANSLVIYPYAHLSSNLAPPTEAVKVLRSIEQALKQVMADKDVLRAPFGWYKYFMVECIGHPLSELSRSYECTTPSKELCTLTALRGDLPKEMKDFLCSSLTKGTSLLRRPKIERTIQERFGFLITPSNGRYSLITRDKSLKMFNVLRNIAASLAKKYKAVEVQISTLHPGKGLKSGFWLFNKDVSNTSTFFEASATSMSSGRLTLFDSVNESILFHRFKTFDDILELISYVASINRKIMKDLNREGILIVEAGSEKGLDKYGFLINELSKGIEQVMAVGHTSFTGFRARYLVKDSSGNFVELGGLEIAEESDSLDAGSNIFGPLQNVVYLALDGAAEQLRNSKTPVIPTWLSPIQVRLLPLKDVYVPYCLEIIEKMSEHGIRAEVDSRSVSLGKKIRDAGREWIPYVVIIGEREVTANVLNVRIRSEGRQVSMNVEELISKVLEESLL